MTREVDRELKAIREALAFLLKEEANRLVEEPISPSRTKRYAKCVEVWNALKVAGEGKEGV